MLNLKHRVFIGELPAMVDSTVFFFHCGNYLTMQRHHNGLSDVH